MIDSFLLHLKPGFNVVYQLNHFVAKKVLFIYILYIEPNWPLFLKVNPPKNKAEIPIKTRGPIWVLDIPLSLYLWFGYTHLRWVATHIYIYILIVPFWFRYLPWIYPDSYQSGKWFFSLGWDSRSPENVACHPGGWQSHHPGVNTISTQIIATGNILLMEEIRRSPPDMYGTL